MPFFILLPLIGRVAISATTALIAAAGVGTVAAGVTGVAVHNNHRSKKNVEEAKRTADTAVELATEQIAEINKNYLAFFKAAKRTYRGVYTQLEEQFEKVGGAMPPGVTAPQNLRFADRIKVSDVGSISFGNISWHEIKKMSDNAAKGATLLTRGSAGMPGAPGNTLAVYGVITGVAIAAEALGGFLENSEMNLTDSERSLEKARTYRDQVTAGLEALASAATADVDTRKATLKAMRAQLAEIEPYEGANSQQAAISIMLGIRELIERPLYFAPKEA